MAQYMTPADFPLDKQAARIQLAALSGDSGQNFLAAACMFNQIKDHLEYFVHWVASGTKLTYVAIGIGLIAAFLYFKIFFGDWDGFKEDVENDRKYRTWFLRLIFWRDTNYIDYEWSHFKIMIWLMISAGCGILAYYQLPHWFPNTFH
jgi:hypothetical protein